MSSIKLEGFKSGNAFVVKLKGRLDSLGAPEFDKKCEEWNDQGENNLILDFKELDYISSMGLRSMLVLGKRIKSRNGKVFLCNLNEMVGGVFKISGFSTIFTIYDGLGQALEQM